MTSYGSDVERRSLTVLRRLLPTARIVNPADHYLSARDWELDWPQLVRQLDALVVFGAEDATVGAGCLREVADAIGHSVPIAVLRGEALCELVSMRFLPLSRRTPARTAIVVAGRPMPFDLSMADHQSRLRAKAAR
jgi:hypothetical protein